jgi:uncharacterized protein involved in outer membrane biogenesis
MKKLVLRLAIVVVVLLIVTAIAGALYLDSIVKKGVETVGPQITKTEMKLAGVGLSVFSGSGELKGFVLGNPEGFNKAASAMTVGHIKVGVAPMSVLGDKVHVKRIHVIEPEIFFEATGFNVRANNLSKILENVQGVAGTTGSTPAEKPAPAEPAASKKLQVDDFLLSNAKVKVTSTSLAGKAVTVGIPDIHFTNLGTGPDGITAAELTKKVLDELVPTVIAAAQNALGDLSKGATELLKGTGENASNAVNKATKSVTDLFKK